MEIFKKIKLILETRLFFLTLVIVVLISYGQMLGMNFYQDDNALMFKLSHIKDEAGFLGKGVFGYGPYSYTAAVNLVVFSLFKYNSLAYFSFGLIFIILSCFIVYWFFLILFRNKLKAATAALLYASGYIGSDGYIRIFNSVLTTGSIIFTCASIGLLWIFNSARTHRFRWYTLSLISYACAIEFGYIRTHYLIAIVVATQIILIFEKRRTLKEFIQQIYFSILKLSPFISLFFIKFFVSVPDFRSANSIGFIRDILSGQLFKTYSFFTTLGNLLVSNEIFPNFYLLLEQKTNLRINHQFLLLFSLLVCICSLLFFLKKKLISVNVFFGYSILTTVSLSLVKSIYNNPTLQIGSTKDLVSLYTGVTFTFLSIISIVALPSKKLSSLFLVWLIINLAAYGAYVPYSSYSSDDRYLIHAVLPLIGFLSLQAFNLKDLLKTGPFTYAPIFLVAAFGLTNLVSAVSLHSKILQNRSEPSRRFFKELQNYYPSFPRGALLYFFIPDKPLARSYFNAGFGVGQMPDQTAIAWRYGIDRYDLSMVDNFQDVKNQLLDKRVPLEHIFSFIADPSELIDTTVKTRELLKSGSQNEVSLNLSATLKITKEANQTLIETSSIELSDLKIDSLTDIDLTLRLSGTLLNSDELTFPLLFKSLGLEFSDEEKQLYLNFREWQNEFLVSAAVTATSFWNKNIPARALDNDLSSYWQANRLNWPNPEESLVIDLKKAVEIEGVVYQTLVNILAPTKLEVFTSNDGLTFEKKGQLNIALNEVTKPQKISFNKHTARFIKLLFKDTFYQDSPAISEVMVLPAGLGEIDLLRAGSFLKNPFGFVVDKKEWDNLRDKFINYGLVKIEWETDGAPYYNSNSQSSIPLRYDGLNHEISLTIPAGGQYLKRLRITPETLPGELILSSVRFSLPSIYIQGSD